MVSECGGGVQASCDIFADKTHSIPEQPTMNRLDALKKIEALLDRLIVDRLVEDEQNQASALPRPSKREQELLAVLRCIQTTVRHQSTDEAGLRKFIDRLVQAVLPPPIVMYDRRKLKTPVKYERRKQT
jgi:hypothetical protein